MGYGMITIPTIINLYYTVIMAFALLFLFSSLTLVLPWSECGHQFNTKNCHSIAQEREFCNATIGEVWHDSSCFNQTHFCESFGLEMTGNETDYCFNKTSGIFIPFRNVYPRSSASEEYWYRGVLGLNIKAVNSNKVGRPFEYLLDTNLNSWSHWGEPRWELIGCLALCWAMVCGSLMKGVQSFGKVVYFTTIFPFVVLTLMVCYISTLDGFSDGMEFYFVPNWTKLADVDVWSAATGQVFFSMGVAVGSQMLLSSYNNFNAQAHRDALLISFGNLATSIYAGIVVFGVVGFIAKQKGIDIPEVITVGPGLAFVVYPEAVSIMDAAPLYSFLFFFMLVLLAISSVCGSWEAFTASILDEFPSLRKERVKVMVISCTVAFLAGIPMCFESGFLLFQLMDHRSANAILLMAFLEVVTVSWFYGTNRFYGDILEMKMWMPKVMGYYWKFCWKFVTPVILGGVTVLSWANRSQDRFLGYEYPLIIQILGWGIELVSIAIVFFGSVYIAFQTKQKGKDVSFIKSGPMMSPKPTWGPREDRIEEVNSESNNNNSEDENHNN